MLDDINMLAYGDMFSTNGVIHKQQQNIFVLISQHKYIWQSWYQASKSEFSKFSFLT